MTDQRDAVEAHDGHLDASIGRPGRPLADVVVGLHLLEACDAARPRGNG